MSSSENLCNFIINFLLDFFLYFQFVLYLGLDVHLCFLGRLQQLSSEPREYLGGEMEY